MTSLFPASEFDDWAIHYDKEVVGSVNFPFTGYSEVLKTINKFADAQKGAEILDLGIGTGNLAILFNKQGCKIWGVDFSAEMLAQAQVKLPSAILEQADLCETLPLTMQRQFDAVVSAYTFHHFPLEEKVSIVRNLLENNLTQNGKLIIGDIAFRDSAEEDALRIKLGAEWEQEYYWIADVALESFAKAGVSASFTRVSSYAAIFQFGKRH